MLFELAKAGFGYYIHHFASFEKVYGALAAIPIFMLWVYLSWLVVLLAAEFVYCLSTYRSYRAARNATATGDFVIAFRLLGHLASVQHQGGSLTLGQLMQREPVVFEEVLRRVLTVLERSHIVHRVQGTSWALARDISTMTLFDLYSSYRYILPRGELPLRDTWDSALAEVLRESDACLAQRLGVPLGPLYREADGARGK